MSDSRFLRIVLGSLLLVCLAFAGPAFAAYPEKPVNLLIPYGGGGSTDVTARMLANLAQKDFPKPIVVVNKPGGGGVLMHELLAQAKPDGYTLGIVSTGVLTRTLSCARCAMIPRRTSPTSCFTPSGNTVWWSRQTAPGRPWMSSWTTPRPTPAR